MDTKKPAQDFALAVTDSSGHTFTVTSKRDINIVAQDLFANAKRALGKD